MFKDKTVLVTGSSQGIGKAIAIKLASLGANVALNDIASQEDNLKKTKEEIEKMGVKANYYFADVSKMEEVEKMVSSIKDDFSRLDVLVNNAGITKDRTLAKMTKEEWDMVIDINLNGVFHCTKAVLPLIIEAQGSIINISSIVGERGNFGQANYAATKAGIIGFTKSLAKEIGRFGARANAIAPGFIETKMAEAIPEEVKVGVKRLTSLGRFGKPEEIANTVAFLASSESSFITGAIINVDGGLSI